MRFGFVASVLFHLCIVGGIVVWGHDWANRELISEPTIPVELISEAKLAERTNVPTIRKDVPEEAPPEPEIPDEPVAIEPEPVPVLPEPVVDPVVEAPAEIAPPEPEVTTEPEPEPVPDVPAPEAPKPKPKPPEPKPDPKPVKKPEKPKSDGLDLDELDAFAEQAKNNQTQREPSEAPSAVRGSTDVDGGVGELTASETALVKAHLKKCWTPLAGAPNAETLVVTIDFDLNRDGTLKTRPKVVNALQINTSGNRYWQVAEDIAMRAVLECQPYDFLPQDRYDIWKEIRLDFNPAEMAGF